MFDQFGEFDSAEELNRAAAAQLAEKNNDIVLAVAEENGIDREDAQDYIDGAAAELATPLMAALGKLAIEKKKLEISGILNDWTEYLEEACGTNPEMADAVRRKGKSLKMAMAALICFAFEHKVCVNDEIVHATKIIRNGKEEPLRGPLYLGVPNRTQAKKLLRDYYLGEGGREK